QQVAQLALQRGQVVAVDCIGDLVGLLDRVRRDRGEGLLDVPRASRFAIAQAGHDVEQALEVGRRLRHVAYACPPTHSRHGSAGSPSAMKSPLSTVSRWL